MKVQPRWAISRMQAARILLVLGALTGASCSTRGTDPRVAQPLSPTGACDVQNGVKLPHLRLRAVGTEPFWGARITGRCVTYSHPDDQAGTRIWTKYEGSPGDGRWVGALNGSPFELRAILHPECS